MLLFPSHDQEQQFQKTQEQAEELRQALEEALEEEKVAEIETPAVEPEIITEASINFMDELIKQEQQGQKGAEESLAFDRRGAVIGTNIGFQVGKSKKKKGKKSVPIQAVEREGISRSSKVQMLEKEVKRDKAFGELSKIARSQQLKEDPKNPLLKKSKEQSTKVAEGVKRKKGVITYSKNIKKFQGQELVDFVTRAQKALYVDEGETIPIEDKIKMARERERVIQEREGAIALKKGRQYR